MAKQKVANLDLEKEDGKVETAAAAEQLGEGSSPQQGVVEPAVVRLAIVEVPLVDVPHEAYRPRHLNVQLNALEADAMKKLLAGLDHRGDRLTGGRRVQTAADAVRWVLEQIVSSKP